MLNIFYVQCIQATLHNDDNEIIIIIIAIIININIINIDIYIETAYDMHQLIDQPTRVDDKTSSVLDVVLTSHPALHRKRAVLIYTLSDHYLIYTHMEFENIKPSVVDHNIVKFRDMKDFDMENFSNDLISCDILNGSQDNISWDRWKLAYTDICDKYAPMKSLRLKKRSNPWMTHDVMKLM